MAPIPTEDMKGVSGADEEMAAEPWFYVGEHDIFPEEFRKFLIGRSDVREM